MPASLVIPSVARDPGRKFLENSGRSQQRSRYGDNCQCIAEQIKEFDTVTGFHRIDDNAHAAAGIRCIAPPALRKREPS
jgi:hypothetical protein